ncbi:MAG TPA: hypothetical protein VEC12_11010 [Bacteroidia bacterium]|nr:hypothetical protein [Bacteroidia bacterium]
MKLLYCFLFLVLLFSCEQKVNNSINNKPDSISENNSKVNELNHIEPESRSGIHYDSLLTRHQIALLEDTNSRRYWTSKADYYQAYDYFIKLREQLKKYNPLAERLNLPATAKIVEYKKLRKLNRSIVL